MRFIMISLSLLTISCVGTLYSERNPEIADATPFEGVLHFQPVPVVVTYATNQLVAGDPKKVVGSAPEDCTPVSTQKIERMPDYTTPYRVFYEPGWFESGKFSVTLEQGVLKTVNSEYVPGSQQLVDLTKATAELVTGVGALGIVAGPDDKPPCNSGSLIIGIGPLGS